MQTKLPHLDIKAYKGLRVPAKIVTYFFHPVFMPTVMAIILTFLNVTDFRGLNIAQRNQLWGNFAMNTIFFPLVSVLLLKAVGFIDSVQMHTTKDRIMPLIATMMFYFWAYLIMKGLQAPLILKVLSLGAFWGIVVVFILNIFIKVSMHTAAAGGAIGVILVLMMYSPTNLILPLLITMVVAGIIGTARLVMQAHTPFEIWLGYIAGILVQLAAYLYLLL